LPHQIAKVFDPPLNLFALFRKKISQCTHDTDFKRLIPGDDAGVLT
jgi:hypothetical protein